MDQAEKMWRKERAGGNYGAGTKEVQQRNYVMVRYTHTHTHTGVPKTHERAFMHAADTQHRDSVASTGTQYSQQVAILPTGFSDAPTCTHSTHTAQPSQHRDAARASAAAWPVL